MLVAWIALAPVFGRAEVRVVVDGLQSPSAIAVRPSKDNARTEIVIAESGAGRVVTWRSGEEEPRPLIGASPDDLPDAVPSALIFLTDQTLAVAWADKDARFEVTSLHQCKGRAAELITVRKPSKSERPIAGALGGFALGQRHLYATSREEEHTVVLRARRYSSKLGAFHQVLALDADESVAACESPEGYLLATSKRRLEFFDGSADAKPLPSRLAIETNLPTTRTIRYGLLPRPTLPRLYALQAGADAGQDGLYRLDARLRKDGTMACGTTLMAKIERPVDVAFARDGTAYVLVSGEQAKGGQLLQLTGGF